MRLVFVTGVLLAGALLTAPARALQVCINAPGYYNGPPAEDAVEALLALEPRCVRVTIHQEQWSDLTDPAAEPMLASFEALVDRYRAAGIEPYMLINGETMNQGPHLPNDAAGRDTFSKNALAVIDRMKPRIRRFEILNEPNNWDASMKPTNPPDAVAALLAELYGQVKVDHAGDACWGVDIVSGALFAFHQGNGTGTSASDYLEQMYASGISDSGWEALKTTSGSYPLDGIGWHVYVETADAATTQSEVSGYLSDVWGVIQSHEGAGTKKKIWISEFGFPTDGSGSQNDAQAAGLDDVYATLAADSHVAMGMWFTLADFPGGPWGLYSAGGFDVAHARPAKDHFVTQVAQRAEPLWSRLRVVSAPSSMEVGASATVTVAAKNLGTETWTRADKVRLGAGSGCPLSVRANDMGWQVADPDGYANSPTDARLYLDPSASVAHGDEVTMTLTLVAPSSPGAHTFSARMVKEAVGWIGTSVDIDVDVAAPSGGGGSAAAGAGGTSGAAGGSGAGGSEAGGAHAGSAGAAGASGDGGAASGHGGAVAGAAGHAGNGGASAGSRGDAGGASAAGRTGITGGQGGSAASDASDGMASAPGGCGCSVIDGRASAGAAWALVALSMVMSRRLSRRDARRARRSFPGSRDRADRSSP